MPCIDGRDTRYRENRGRKRSFDEKEDHFDLKAPSAKEQCIDVENAEVSSKLIYNTERDRSEISDVGDYKRNDQLKSSPATSVNTAKDQDRHHSKQAESGCRDSLPEERRRQSATVAASTLGGSGSWQLEKSKPKNDYPSGELLMENTASQDVGEPRVDQMDEHHPLGSLKNPLPRQASSDILTDLLSDVVLMLKRQDKGVSVPRIMTRASFGKAVTG
ncbi:hypothetical protein QJS10_CPA01g02147 [Acorus calamus]|uniref:Uncharacterized protein n=1 Tax=Acorus calamus TaxID=4465 RepID=A0AAV9FMZ2_ACOCL|nr:hypothetical protein QJS10_CPA01g02147 [Acorus calamus]